jgi:hypothetical protein
LAPFYFVFVKLKKRGLPLLFGGSGESEYESWLGLYGRTLSEQMPGQSLAIRMKQLPSILFNSQFIALSIPS